MTNIAQTEMVRAFIRANPPVIMTLEDVAAVVDQSYNHVRNELQHRPDFPPKLDRFKQPRWSRDAVLRWAGVNA